MKNRKNINENVEKIKIQPSVIKSIYYDFISILIEEKGKKQYEVGDTISELMASYINNFKTTHTRNESQYHLHYRKEQFLDKFIKNTEFLEESGSLYFNKKMFDQSLIEYGKVSLRQSQEWFKVFLTNGIFIIKKPARKGEWLEAWINLKIYKLHKNNKGDHN